MDISREMVTFLRKQYPPGTRIRLDNMDDPFAPVPGRDDGNGGTHRRRGAVPHEMG